MRHAGGCFILEPHWNKTESMDYKHSMCLISSFVPFWYPHNEYRPATYSHDETKQDSRHEKLPGYAIYLVLGFAGNPVGGVVGYDPDSRFTQSFDWAALLVLMYDVVVYRCVCRCSDCMISSTKRLRAVPGVGANSLRTAAGNTKAT
eukprot:1791709-Amphidinium_carterae.1